MTAAYLGAKSDKVDNKSFATLRARAALRGYALHELADGSFLIARWNLTRPLPDLRAVESFLEAAGA